MELPVEKMEVQAEYTWVRVPELTPEQRLAVYIIRDSIDNIKERNAYTRASFALLVDANGELTFWLSFFPKRCHSIITDRIYKFLESHPDLYM